MNWEWCEAVEETLARIESRQEKQHEALVEISKSLHAMAQYFKAKEEREEQERL